MTTKFVKLAPTQIAELSGEALLCHFRSRLNVKVGCCAELETFENLLSDFMADIFVSPVAPTEVLGKKRKAKKEPEITIQDLKIKRVVQGIEKVFEEVNQRIQMHPPAKKGWSQVSKESKRLVREWFAMKGITQKNESVTEFLTRITIAQIALAEFSTELKVHRVGLSIKFGIHAEPEFDTDEELFVAIWKWKENAVQELFMALWQSKINAFATGSN
jgi:hypothetical protein